MPFVTFCAYYPYSEPSDNISFESTGRWTILNYSVPTDISKQVDLLSARSIPYSTYNKPIVSLLFNHALTAIQFKTGSQLPAGVVIKSLTFKNIYFKGKHLLGTKGEAAHAWTVDQTQKRDFTLALNYISDGTEGKDITTPDNTFFLLPQALPDNAVLEVTMMINGQLKTLKKAINGKTWKQGEKIVYNLSSSKITQETFTLEAVATGSANYDGSGNISYTVKSTKKDGLGHSSFVPWTMEFSTDNGVHWTTNKPDFITLTTQENNGDLTAKSYTATFAPQTKITEQSSSKILKARTILNDVDLAHRDVLGNEHHNGQTTANCYVIHNPGTYKFPTIYGNAMKNGQKNERAYKSSKQGQQYILSPFINAYGQGITKPQIDGITNACLIWQDTQNLISNISFDSANQYVKFEVNKATIHNGNAIIAVRDNSNTILWSWHIWVTEEDLTPVEIENYQHFKYNILPVNLGWCGMNAEVYAQREVKIRIKQQSGNKTVDLALNQRGHFEGDRKNGNNPYYQWGRKDPMLPSNGLGDVDKKCFPGETQYQFVDFGINTDEIKEYIQNPHKFNTKEEMDGVYYNLWSIDNDRLYPNDDVVIKTVYDPSPVGYSLPTSNVFTGFTTTGELVNNNSALFNVKDAFDKGWLFYCKPNKQGDTVFFPASGWRTRDSGLLHYMQTYGFYWVAGPYNTFSSRSLAFGSGVVNQLGYAGRSYGFSVRPALEK